jgi:DNA-binding NarL/FixJ family response regulator
MDKQLVRVAYAEDHVAVRKGIISILQLSGDIEVDIEADNGAEMLRKLMQTRKLPDVCIIDINMPEMDGFSLLLEIKKRWPRMRTLILTLYDNEAYIIKMIRQGANGYLLKTCDPAEIRTALISIHEHGYYYSHTADQRKFDAVLNKEVKPLHLTDAEKEFLKYSCADLSYSEIAVRMNTSLRSVQGYRDRLFKKLNVSNRVALALYAIQEGIVTIEISNHLNNKL